MGPHPGTPPLGGRTDVVRLPTDHALPPYWCGGWPGIALCCRLPLIQQHYAAGIWTVRTPQVLGPADRSLLGRNSALAGQRTAHTRGLQHVTAVSWIPCHPYPPYSVAPPAGAAPSADAAQRVPETRGFLKDLVSPGGVLG